MTSIRLSREGIARFRSLLDAAMCDRPTLLRHLASLDYEINPDLDGEAERDATGYIVCPIRHFELTGMDVAPEAQYALAAKAHDLPLTPAQAGGDPWRMMLDAILSDIVVPTKQPHEWHGEALYYERPPLHPPRKIEHRGSKRPMVHVSRQAKAALERMDWGVYPCGPGRQMQFVQILRRLADFRYDWNEPRREVKPYPRARFQSTAEGRVLEYLASEGLRLGFPAHRGGRRTPLAVAANVIEAIGQEAIIPVGPRIREGATAAQDE